MLTITTEICKHRLLFKNGRNLEMVLRIYEFDLCIPNFMFDRHRLETEKWLKFKRGRSTCSAILS